MLTLPRGQIWKREIGSNFGRFFQLDFVLNEVVIPGRSEATIQGFFCLSTSSCQHIIAITNPTAPQVFLGD